jgi:hypothetical protein
MAQVQNQNTINIIQPPTLLRSYTQINVHPTTMTNPEVVTNTLFIGGFDFGMIPSNAIITGITVTVRRRIKGTNTYNLDTRYVRDNSIQLTKDVTSADPTMISPNFSITDRWDRFPLMSNSFQNVTYPGYNSPPSPLWGFPSILVSELVPNFGVLYSLKVKNYPSTISVVLPQIECITITISYYYEDDIYTYLESMFMDGNVKFDTSLYDFGQIREFIFSKVNENKNILKINQERDTSMYPIIDEYGYTYSSRFIFKSPWDREYFIRTNSSLSAMINLNNTTATTTQISLD